MQAEDFKSEGDRILSSFHEWVKGGADGASGWALEKENHEGYRVNVDEGEGKQGWLLLRASLHDPLLVLNVESDVTGGRFASEYVQDAINAGHLNEISSYAPTSCPGAEAHMPSTLAVLNPGVIHYSVCKTGRSLSRSRMVRNMLSGLRLLHRCQ